MPAPQAYVAIVDPTSGIVQEYVTLVDSSGNLVYAANQQPQGRLTLISGAPVAGPTTVTAAPTVYYTPYVGNIVPVWNSTAGRFLPEVFTELSNILANSSVGNAGPVAAVAGSNYDLYVWKSGNSLFLTRGPAWSSDVTRGAPAATTLVNGLRVNTASITNGPAALAGTYVGTIRTDSGGATVSWLIGAAGTTGTQLASLGFWNAYNRIDARGNSQQTAAAWTYSSATIRAANNDANTAVQFIRGIDEEAVTVEYACAANTAAVAVAFGTCGLGLDVTNAYSGLVAKLVADATSVASPQAIGGTPTGRYSAFPGQGWHKITACEQGDGTNNTTWGIAGTSISFNQLSYAMKA